MDSPLNLEPLKISNLLREFDLFPKKGLGQNFLSDPNILEKIVETAEVTQNTTVLEIGPGLGSLTRYLAARAKKVVAVELDEHLIPVLRYVLEPWDNVTIIHGDILDLNMADIMKSESYQVVANIPYYITSALIRHLLESPNPPQQIVLTIQKEVAERICARNRLSLLALSIQVYGTPSMVLNIPSGAFYPPPKVDSKVIRIDLFKEPLIERNKLDLFFRLAKAGFSQKRKTLSNSVSSGLSWTKDDTNKLLMKADIDPQRRAETLTIDEWRILVNYYADQIHS